MVRARSIPGQLALVLVLAAGSAGAQEPTPEAMDPAALAIARRAGDFLRDAEHFRFTAEIGYETVQADGVRLEFGATKRYQVARPDRLRVETERRSGDRRMTLFDGTTFVMADLDENAYARADLKTPHDIDFVVDLVRERLDTPLPLAELLRNDPRQSIEDALESAAVVGGERLRGVDCDHLLLRNTDADLQLWIARGEQPLVQRVVITYRTLDGAPGFWADLDEWRLGDAADASRFRYTPPEGAERIRFEVRPAPPAGEEGSS